MTAQTWLMAYMAHGHGLWLWTRAMALGHGLGPWLWAIAFGIMPWASRSRGPPRIAMAKRQHFGAVNSEAVQELRVVGGWVTESDRKYFESDRKCEKVTESDGKVAESYSDRK